MAMRYIQVVCVECMLLLNINFRSNEIPMFLAGVALVWLSLLHCFWAFHDSDLFSFRFHSFGFILHGMDCLTNEEISRVVERALEEDLGTGDVTSMATVPEHATAKAVMVSRQNLVVCGLTLAATAFRLCNDRNRVLHFSEDGQGVGPGRTLLRVEGPARAILAAERVALNFVQRLSGIATLTHAFVTRLQGTGARILDTRKTTPGWRRLEKYAVRCGGGTNHRFGLYDQVLIKDNHLVALQNASPNAIAAAVVNAQKLFPNLKIEVEAETLEQVEQAVEAGADIILLDNMELDQLRAAVDLVNRRALTEASGGVNLETVHAIAETGVDFISVGALTHSVPSVDIALDFMSRIEGNQEELKGTLKETTS